MKNPKLIPMKKSKKKYQILTGVLPLPLKVGERAWICFGSQTITTTTVQCIWEVSADGILFETCNTIYQLNFIFHVNSEVMCA